MVGISVIVNSFRHFDITGKNAIIDQWLECSHCLMENCCFYDCGSTCCTTNTFLDNGKEGYIRQDNQSEAGGIGWVAIKIEAGRGTHHALEKDHRDPEMEEVFIVDESRALKRSISKIPTFSTGSSAGCCCGANCREWRQEFDHY